MCGTTQHNTLTNNKQHDKKLFRTQGDPRPDATPGEEVEDPGVGEVASVQVQGEHLALLLPLLLLPLHLLHVMEGVFRVRVGGGRQRPGRGGGGGGGGGGRGKERAASPDIPRGNLLGV